MKLLKKANILIIASALLVTSQIPAHSFTSLIAVAVWAIREDTKKALQIPQHASWCKKKHPGYRVKWNNYKVANGRVKYCASPFHTPFWMQKGAVR